MENDDGKPVFFFFCKKLEAERWSLLFYFIRKEVSAVAELALPKNKYEAILVDYKDKHEGRPGFTSMARKFSIPKRKDKQEVLDMMLYHNS